MNRLIRSYDLKDLEKYVLILRSIQNSEHEQKPDALVKWASIMKIIDDLKIEPKKILDAGSGKSHISLAIDKMLENSLEEIRCLDIVSPIATLQTNEKCKFKVQDFFESSNDLENEYFDLIIDGCSVTHFDTNSKHSHNDGCFKMGKVAERILKKGGYLICASDVLSFNDDQIKGEFISIELMVSAYEAGGIKLISDLDKSIDDCVLVDYVVHGKNLAIGTLAFRK